MTHRVPYGFTAQPEADAPAAPTPVTVRAIEVVQAIQNVLNSVTLVAGKATVVRVYLDPPHAAAAGGLSGELAWRRGTAGEAYLPAMRAMAFDPAAHPALEDQRLDTRASLNFLLPAEAIAPGRLELRVNRVFSLAGHQYGPAGAAATAVDFQAVAPLRVRAIGLRYRRNGAGPGFAPDSIHFDYFRSYLARAYPVATIEWSQQVVEADFTAPFNDASPDLANAQLAALRSREVSGGVDPRTHYYGLVSDKGGFMRGKAFDIPGDPRPDTVAVGPVGFPANQFGGDLDQSYADWYGAHELGHTFGRYHPGFPPFDPQDGSGQDASDATFPYPDGRISDDDGGYLGFDLGDPGLGLEMGVLPGTDCHDIMTYKERQWLSAYTYEAILNRLRAEDELVP